MEEKTISGLRCLISYPKNFSKDSKYPVILLLHGAGTRGEEIAPLREGVYYKFTQAMEEFPFVTVAPLCTENTWFDLFGELKALATALSTADFTDPDHLYVMGASMGGYATWQLAMSLPHLFAAIVPICGGGMYWNAARLKNVPVLAFHGAKDGTVKASESVNMVEAVNAKGGRAQLVLYPENKHDAWSDTYSNPRVFAWLLEQKRSDAPAAPDLFRHPDIYG